MRNPPGLDRSRHSILVADDHAGQRYALARELRAAGFSTLEAGSGASALELAPFAAAAVIDMNLPDLYGSEVCRLIRKNPATARMPVIQVSALPEEVSRDEAMDAGCDHFLRIPVEVPVLLAVLEDLLWRREAQDAAFTTPPG